MKPPQQNYVLTFIANPKQPFGNALVTDLQKRMKRLVDAMKLEWLAEKEAFQIVFATDELQPMKIEMRELMKDKPYDYALLDGGKRKKKLLVSDMDSTMIQQECIDELADFAGIKEQVSAITEAAMRGEIEFKEALTRRVALLKGMEDSILDKVYKERIKLMPGAKTLIATMRERNDARTLLVSGGFTYFTRRVADAIGFDGEMANSLEIVDGKFTGKVVPPILDKDSKLLALQKVAEAYHLSLEKTMAVGDGANDLPMIEAAGIGVAYKGKDVVKKAAKASIEHNDLTALLYLQGYKKSEFVQAE